MKISAPDSCSPGDTITICVVPAPNPPGTLTCSVDTAGNKIVIEADLNDAGCADVTVPKNGLGLLSSYPGCEDVATTVTP